MKLIKNINFILYIIIFNVSIKKTFQIFCDKTQYCSDCSICGKDTNIYCACNFNNAFCKNEYNDNYNFLSDFLFNYDGCITNNDEFYDVCGVSDIYLEPGINNTIRFIPTIEKDILCFYNLKLDKNINNNLYITLKKKEKKSIDLSLYFIYYFQTDETNIFIINDIKTEDESYYYINEHNVEMVSIYVSIKDTQNINDFSIDFYLETNFITTKISHNIDTENKKKLIFIIIIGIIALVIIFFILLLIVKKCKSKKSKNKNIEIIKIDKNFSIKGYKSINRDKIKKLFENELSPKIYHKKDVKSDSYKCTICQEDFEEGISFVTTTKCKHNFHFNCFKKFVEKNIIFPKCPNCNTPILNKENLSNQSLTNNTNQSSTFENNNQTTQNIYGINTDTNIALEPHDTTTV